MNNKVYEVKLDMKRATSTRGEWVVVEGDNGNKIEITLTDDGAPVNLSNCRALAVFGKPDGTTVEQDTEGNGLTVSGDDHNIITIELYAGSFSPGPMKCEIQVYSGENYGTLITSAQFTFKCRRGIMNSDTVQSVPEYPILLSATAAAEEATAEALAAAATARSSVQSDWTEADAENPRYIQHKPTAFTPSAHASTHASGGADPVVSKWEKTLEPSAWSDGIIDMALPVTEANVVLIQGISDDDKKNFAKAEIAVTHISTGIRFTATTAPETNIALNVAAI